MNTRNVLDWLENAARIAPEAAAFDMPGSMMTWRSLQRRAREVGSFLAARVPAQSPVMILMDKSPECAAAMLGTVYAGCFYTPVDSGMPEARMRLIFSVLRPALILCEEKTAAAAAAVAEGTPVILLSEIPGLRCNEPDGAFYVFPKFDFDMTSHKFAERLLQERHIAITPGRAFGPCGEGSFRLSYSASDEDLTEGIGRIKAFCSQL